MASWKLSARFMLIALALAAFIPIASTGMNAMGNAVSAAELPPDWAEYVRLVKKHRELDPMLSTRTSDETINSWLESSSLTRQALKAKSEEVRESVEQARRRQYMQTTAIPAEFMEQLPDMMREQINQMREMFRGMGMSEEQIEEKIEELKREMEEHMGIQFDDKDDKRNADDRNRQFGAAARPSDPPPLMAARELGIRFDVPESIGSTLDQTRSTNTFSRAGGWRALREKHADEMTPELFTSILPQMKAALDDEAHTVRTQAALAIARGGPNAAPALPRLIKLIESAPAPSADPHQRPEDRGLEEADANRLHVAYAAQRAVGTIGPAAFEPARRMYQSDDPARKAWALAIMRDLGPAAAGMHGEFVSLAHDDSVPMALRVFAVEAVGATAQPDSPETSTLVGLLAHDERIMRLAAIRSLGRLQPAGHGVERRLVRMVCDAPNDRGLAKDAGEAIRVYGRSGAQAIADQIEACPPAARSTLAEVLQDIGEDDGEVAAKIVVPTLLTIGVRPRPSMRAAVERWEELRPTEPQETRRVVAIRRDIERLNPNRPGVQFEFEEILHQRVRVLTPGEKAWLVPLALEMLSDPMLIKQQGGVLLVAELGPQAVSTVPRLTELLVDTRDPQRAQMIAYALSEIGPGARSALPALERWNTRHDAPFVIGIAIQKIKGELE